MKRILIVEDSEDMRMFYGYMFREESGKYAIEFESDPLKALGRLGREHFDLMISDIVMDSMSGENFLEAVKEDKKNRDMPVVVVSVLKPEMMGNVGKMRRVYFLQKPITKERLFKVIDKSLRRGKRNMGER